MADHDIDDSEFPDNDEFVPYVSAGTLAQRSGTKVMCWGQVNSVSSADTFSIKTADGQEIMVKLRQPANEHLEGWYEITGVAQSKGILCDDYIPLSPEFTSNIDLDGHRGLVRLLAALDDPWNLGEEQHTNGHDGIAPMHH